MIKWKLKVYLFGWNLSFKSEMSIEMFAGMKYTYLKLQYALKQTQKTNLVVSNRYKIMKQCLKRVRAPKSRWLPNPFCAHDLFVRCDPRGFL